MGSVDVEHDIPELEQQALLQVFFFFFFFFFFLITNTVFS
jgi:hypothetical protein